MERGDQLTTHAGIWVLLAQLQELSAATLGAYADWLLSPAIGHTKIPIDPLKMDSAPKSKD